MRLQFFLSVFYPRILARHAALYIITYCAEAEQIYVLFYEVQYAAYFHPLVRTFFFVMKWIKHRLTRLDLYQVVLFNRPRLGHMMLDFKQFYSISYLFLSGHFFLGRQLLVTLVGF